MKLAWDWYDAARSQLWVYLKRNTAMCCFCGLMASADAAKYKQGRRQAELIARQMSAFVQMAAAPPGEPFVLRLSQPCVRCTSNAMVAQRVSGFPYTGIKSFAGSIPLGLHPNEGGTLTMPPPTPNMPATRPARLHTAG